VAGGSWLVTHDRPPGYFLFFNTLSRSSNGLYIVFAA
jgi:hypothetical protein